MRSVLLGSSLLMITIGNEASGGVARPLIVSEVLPAMIAVFRVP
jgi:hypothetical protein